MNKFYILSYDANYIDQEDIAKLVKELRKDFSQAQFYTIAHFNHQKGPIYLLSSEGTVLLPR